MTIDEALKRLDDYDYTQRGVLEDLYNQGRTDAIDEFAKILHKSIGLDRSLNHHDVDFLADMAKENGFG